MQFRHALVPLLLAILCVQLVAGQHTLRRRQDEGEPPPPPASSAAPDDAPPPSKSMSEAPRTTNNGDRPKQTKSNGDATKITTSKSSTSTANVDSKKDKEEVELPIKPSVTPAIGITGVVLILTGTAYCLIGIKHEWLLVFMSTAYVASLGITVLILYVMNPPVSDAIQGAYFVAACMTGLIFGGFSLIFKEVTSGFGCLVGGFCLAMWFLCLKAGGLVTDTTGKAITIGVFSAVGWSLAFSQYTRNYGSIFCTAFAGAMITIIGIDCFSRAGLKEFWIYLWDLNDKEFPLHTDTYPITRGMRAELACTVVLCILGLISQMKVWKMVKERKAKKEEERQQDETHRDNRDRRFGKDVEKRNTRSLAAWETLYGDRGANTGNAESGTDTSFESLKKSTSVRERELDSVELEEMESSTEQPRGGKTRRSYVEPGVTNIAEIQRSAPGLDLDLGSTDGDHSWWDGYKSSRTSPNQSMKTSLDNADPSRPPVPALPFSPLNHQDAPGPAAQVPVMNSRELQPSSAAQAEPEQEIPIEIEQFEDDRASSIAGTLDSEPDFDALSKRLSFAASVLEENRLSFQSAKRKSMMTESPAETPMDEKDNEELLAPVVPKAKRKAHEEEAEGDTEQKSETPAATELKDGNLPRSISRVAHVYRTNEWAKHIAEADQPEILEELDQDEAPVHVDVGRVEEEPRPVDAVALAPAEQPQFFRTASNPYRRPSEKETQPKQAEAPLRRLSSGTPVYAFQRQTSTTSVNARQNSSTSLLTTKRDQQAQVLSRDISKQTLVESPTENSFATNINLMDERSARVESRPVTANFNGIRPASRSTPLLTPEPSAVQLVPDNGPILGADTNLEQRNTFIPPAPAKLPPNTLNNRSASTAQRPSSSRISRSSSQNLIYDSHQPQRGNSASQIKQNAMLTQWRHSLQVGSSDEHLQPHEAAHEARARQSMIDQLRYRDYQELKQVEKKKKRESRMELAMRTSELADKHKSAMKKMQAQAAGGAEKEREKEKK